MVHNGRSTSGRQAIDWLYLQKYLEEHNLSLARLSCMIGKSKGYLYACRYHNGVSTDIIDLIVERTGIDRRKLISYDKFLLRKEIVSMVQDYTLVPIDDEKRAEDKSAHTNEIADTFKLSLGQKVKHKTYGCGNVLRIDQERNRILIEFSKPIGIRELALKESLKERIIIPDGSK